MLSNRPNNERFSFSLGNNKDIFKPFFFLPTKKPTREKFQPCYVEVSTTKTSIEIINILLNKIEKKNLIKMNLTSYR